MKTGRPRKPKVLKQLSGTLKKHRDRPEPVAVGVLHDAPAALSAEERAVWNDAIARCPPGLLGQVDVYVFTELVLSVAELNLSEAHLRADGPVVTKGGDTRITIHPNGGTTKTRRSPTQVPSPWWTIRNDAFVRFMRATSEIGFSPVSRGRFTLAGGDGTKKKPNRFAVNSRAALSARLAKERSKRRT